MDKRASLNSIPVLNPEEQHRHHFGHNRLWEKQLESGFHQFHINRIEEAKELIRFPLSPHRKTTYDFIFLEAMVVVYVSLRGALGAGTLSECWCRLSPRGCARNEEYPCARRR